MRTNYGTMVELDPVNMSILLEEGPSGDDVVVALVESMRETFESVWSGDTPRSLSSLPEVIGSAMHLVERTGKLSGLQKKQAVVGLTVQLIDDWGIGGSMEPTVLRMIPHLIDTLLIAEKGDLKIRRNKGLLGLLCASF